MRLLLDTHVFLWMNVSPHRLSSTTRTLLAGDADLVVSIAAVWELGIKSASKKLTLPEPIEDFVLGCAALAPFTFLPIELRHVIEAANLPRHHGDPFDRIVIAQARLEKLTVVTVDRWFSRYDVDVIVA